MNYTYQQKRKTPKEIEAIVAEVSIGDLYDRPHFRLLQKDDGFLLQFIYFEASVNDPGSEPIEQRCRKWYMSAFSTKTEIVRTAFKAVQASMMHRLGEHFRYRGKQIHSPHLHVDGLLEIADHQDRRA